MVITKRQIELESIFLIGIVVVGSMYFTLQKNNFQPLFSAAPDVSHVSAPAESIAPKITVSSQISPDGAKKVIMKATENIDGTITYDFSSANNNGENEQFVFSKTASSSDKMSIPFNTWSPDNKYFFIHEVAGGNKSELVFNASGAPFSESEPYLEAVDVFNKQNTGNNFEEATGWASETLIIINAKDKNGERVSYWFEVPSKAIVPLSTDF